MRLTRYLTFQLAASLFAVAATFDVLSGANAQTIDSAYSSTARKDCRVIGAHNGVDDSTTRVCPGKAGLIVLASEDDLRETVSRSAATAPLRTANRRRRPGSARSIPPRRPSNGG